MAITWADVLLIASELSTTATATQNAILEDVDREVDDGAWGEFANKGKKYLAAHLATITAQSGAGGAGPITSETLGPMSRSYASAADTGNSLTSTRYGMEYLRILRIAVGPCALVP